jgi:hypothetical protein
MEAGDGVGLSWGMQIACYRRRNMRDNSWRTHWIEDGRLKNSCSVSATDVGRPIAWRRRQLRVSDWCDSGDLAGDSLGEILAGWW